MKKEFINAQFEHSNNKFVTALNYYKEHVHQQYELLFILNGSGRFLIEDVEYTFSNNSMFLIPPGKYHLMTKLPEVDYDRIVLYFKPELLPKLLEKKLYFKKETTPSSRDLVVKYCDFLERLSDKVLSELIPCFITEILLTEFYGNTPLYNEQLSVPPLVKSAIEYINNNIDKPLTTKIIADALFISHTHLGHAFSHVMNGGIMHYVQIKKIYKAQELLKQGYTATTVAEMLGYKSYPTFIRNYKTYLSTTPSQDKK